MLENIVIILFLIAIIFSFLNIGNDLPKVTKH